MPYQPRRNSSNYTIPRVKKKQKGPAKDGECKFNGTDYPEWLGFDPKQPGNSFTNPFPAIDGDPWEKTMHMIKEHDEDMCDMWDGEIQNLLVFSGLFSAVVTAFAIETQKLLEADPDKAAVLLLAQLAGQLSANVNITEDISKPFQNPNSTTQTFRVNCLIFTSLVLSLGTALVGIIALQWIRSYRSSESASDRERISLRQIRYAALVKWKVPTIISYLPLLLGLALLIFFFGLIDFLGTMNPQVAIIIGVIVGLISLFLLITTVLPTIHIYTATDPMPPCPYQSPQSWLCYKFFDSIFVWGNKRTSYCKNWTELILDLHKKSIQLDPRKEDMWLKNSLVWIFTKFNSSHSFRLAYHCLQSIHNMYVGWDVVFEVIGDSSDLKKVGKEIWDEIQSALPPIACTEYLSTLLLLWNCPLGPRYTLYRSELYYRCIHTFSQFNTDTELWPEYKKLIQLWWGKASSTPSAGATSSLEDRKAYLATFLTALESNPSVSQGMLTFSLFWKFLSLRVQDEDSVPTVLDCLRVLKRWFLRVEQLTEVEFRSWDTNLVLRYSLRSMFDYNVFNPYFVTAELYNHPTFTAFLDIFIDPKNKRLSEGWNDALQSGWADKWDEFLLESRIDRKYWQLSSSKKRMEQKYQEMMRNRAQGTASGTDPSRRRPTSTFPPPHPSLTDTARTYHPNPTQQSSNNSNKNITSIPEVSSSSSISALANTHVDNPILNDPSSIPLTHVSTHTPTNIPPLRPPLPYMLSTVSSVYPPGQTPTPGILQDDDERPLFTHSPSSSLDLGLTAPGDRESL